MSDSDETTYNPYSFDKNGDAYQAAKFRETLTIKEFAEFLADCDSRQIGEYDTEGWVFYRKKVDPWVKVLSEAVKTETSDDGADDIPKVTDETEFSPEFLKYMKENNLNYSEMDFDCMEYSDIESITAKFDVWKTDKSGNKIEKKIYKNPRFGPSTLKKKIEEYGSLDNWLCSNPLYFKHYERNKKLILAEEIPTDIYNMCLLNYKAAKTSFNAKDFKQYLLDNDMGKLIAELPANFSKQSLEDFFG